MSRPGRPLEQLVEVIERVLADEAAATIESPKRLVDRTTGELREHDVLLTIRQNHHVVLVAIECRVRSRPVGAPDVEAFSAKCSDTGVNQGVIVSSSGYWNSARKKADHLGIRCLDLEEVEGFDWLRAPGLTVYTTNLLSYGWTFFPEVPGLVSKETMEVLDAEGAPLDPSILGANAYRIMHQLLPLDRAPTESSELRIRVDADGLSLRNRDTGAITSVSWAGLRVEYAVRIEVVPFRLAEYREPDLEKVITDVATADFQLGDRSGRLSIVYSQTEGGKIVFASDKGGSA